MAFHGLELFRHDRLTSPDRQIRLLSVVPSYDGSPSSYSLTTYLLNSRRRPGFYAVSYEWGSDKRMHDIVVDGKRFPIRSNLKRFLDRLSAAGEAFIRPVWIDAICIDQSRTAERNSQVKIMGDIFSTADLVLTWLGTNLSNPGSLTETALQLEQWQSSKGWTSFLDRAYSSLNKPTQGQEVPLPALFSLESPLSKMWKCIKLLCAQTYWTRLWIVQELVKAKKLLLLWGDEEIIWDTLAIAFRTIQLAQLPKSTGEPDTSPWAIVKASVPYRVWLHTEGSHQHRSLLETMEIYRESKCSIYHDKAYALTGISSDAHLLPVDYDTSLPDLFINLMELLVDKRHCIKYSHLILEALQLDEWSLTSGSGIPSSLKSHLVACEAEHLGHVLATKAVAIYESTEMIEAEVLEMLLNSKLTVDNDDIMRILAWAKATHQAFHARYRNDINQIAFFAASNGQIGATKSVILVGDKVCSLPGHLGGYNKVFLRVSSVDDFSEDGQSAQGSCESPGLSSPTQSSFLSDLSMEMITRVWLLPTSKPTSPTVRSGRQSSSSKTTIQISYAELVALQNSLDFELASFQPMSTPSSPTSRSARPVRPHSRSLGHDPIFDIIDKTMRMGPVKAKTDETFRKQTPRRVSGEVYVDVIARQLRDMVFNSTESPLNSPE